MIIRMSYFFKLSSYEKCVLGKFVEVFWKQPLPSVDKAWGRNEVQRASCEARNRGKAGQSRAARVNREGRKELSRTRWRAREPEVTYEQVRELGAGVGAGVASPRRRFVCQGVQCLSPEKTINFLRVARDFRLVSAACAPLISPWRRANPTPLGQDSINSLPSCQEITIILYGL